MSEHDTKAPGAAWIDDVERRSNLTRAQFLIWTGQRLQPSVPLYNMAFAFELTGDVDFDRLQRSFDLEIESNDALRTVFGTDGGVPVQRVLPEAPGQLEHVDLRAAADPRSATRQWLDERARRPFDLAACAYDSALVTSARDRHIWFLNQHHLVADAWSSVRVHDRVLRAYAEGGEPPPTQRAFTDYVRSERADRESARSVANRAYWSAREGETLDPLRFYGGPSRPANAGNERVPLPLGTARSTALIERARSLGLFSTDMGVFCAFASALAAWAARTTHAERIAIGVPVHHRADRIARETPGLLMELLPLAIHVDTRRGFDALLREITTESLALLRHASAGVATPELNRNCDMVLNVLNRPYACTAGLHTGTEWIHPGAADADHRLRLQVHDLDGNGTFDTLFDFNTDTFGAHERRLATGQFERMLDAFLADASGPLGEIDLRSAEERRAQVAFSAPPRSTSRDVAPLLERFLERSRSAPDRVALETAGRTVGYGELATASADLAATLIADGVGRGSLVPILVGRRPELVVAILAVLRTGAAYLPLNPAEPPRRLAQILEDAAEGDFRLGPLLAMRDVDVPAELPVDRHDLDANGTPPSGEGASTLPQRAPDDVAYLIYTSGSTGRPKGVVIEDRALDGYLSWAVGRYTDGPTDCALHTSPAVDLTVTSTFLPLVTGGRVRVYPEEHTGADVPVLDVFREDAVDLVKLTPAHLALLQERPGRVERIRTLIVGGEDLKTATVRAVLDRLPDDVRVFNEYGPTETTVGCMTHRFDHQRDHWSSVPIGCPIEGASIELLDRSGNPVPAGVVGEICIGGLGLARGYHNRPDATAAAFETFRAADGGRLYRSGDRGRWAADGRLEFLGRIDDQAKVRGVRLEPGEVEATLVRHPAVQHCAVVLHDAPAHEDIVSCRRCGVPSNHPDTRIDLNGSCTLCSAFEELHDDAVRYFKTREDFAVVVDAMREESAGDYDCLALFSGGKDSTYMVYQLMDAGLRPLTFTLDNGYISEEAKANIRRAVEHIGVDHVFGSTPHMNEIFRDSLARYSNVCDGCFKTIYTLSVNLAREKKIRHIVTGLSRGQIFETRLHDLFRSRVFDVSTIERRIREARKIYHRVDDAVARTLDVSCFANDAVFDEVQFVDFYRYWDVGLDEVYRFLEERAPWVRPSDTGRSTNCLINDAGIFVHKQERGFHNYALPYSWDVRVGHKTRDEAMDELDDVIDEDRVATILREVGYVPRTDGAARREPRLVAYYVGDEVDAAAFREHLASRLPPEMIPTDFVPLDELPLTPSGKVDRAGLPDPGQRPQGPFVAPRNDLESRLAEIWQEVLRAERVGVTDNFFELGGHSLPALQVLARIDDAFGVELPIAGFFNAPTIADLAELVEQKLLDEIEGMSDNEVQGSLAGD